MVGIVCYALRDLVPIVNLKTVKNTHGGVLLLVKLHAYFTKGTLLHGYFSRFLNCTNGDKSRKASYTEIKNLKYEIRREIGELNFQMKFLTANFIRMIVPYFNFVFYMCILAITKIRKEKTQTEVGKKLSFFAQ